MHSNDTTPRVCDVCSKLFEPTRYRLRYCSQECARAMAPRSPSREYVPFGECRLCGEPLKRGRKKFCSAACRANGIKLFPEDRFWPQVNVIPEPGPCWEWTGARNKGGYGIFTPMTAHRFAWFLVHGPIPTGLKVRHFVCDNPPCVRNDGPNSHLRLGTHEQNMDDMRSKGREAKGASHGSQTHPESRPHGSNASWSKLVEAQVIEMRDRYAVGGVTLKALGLEFGIATETVWSIIHRKVWKHV